MRAVFANIPNWSGSYDIASAYHFILHHLISAFRTKFRCWVDLLPALRTSADKFRAAFLAELGRFTVLVLTLRAAHFPSLRQTRSTVSRSPDEIRGNPIPRPGLRGAC